MKQAKIIVLGNAVADVVARPVDEVPHTGSLVHFRTSMSTS